jgi:ABC-type nitrate/sulfonate/bicarbonate transport system substrate-binding protein
MDIRRLTFRLRTAPYRHREAFQFFLLNFALQIIPFGVMFLQQVLHSKSLTLSGHDDAAWTLLAFGLWNAPSAIRIHLSNPQKTARVRLFIYSVSLVVTFIVFWVIFDAGDSKLPAGSWPDSPWIPIGLAALACLTVGAINERLLISISLRLLWAHQSQFSGIYLAKYYGIFAAHGLAIRIEPSDPFAVNSALDRFGGRSQFAILSSTDVVKARDRNFKVRSILVIVPEPAIIFFVREDGPITSYADLKGKRVAFRSGYEEADVLKIMLHSYGLSISDVVQSNCSVDCRELRDGDVDVAAGHEAVEPLVLAQAGVYIRTLPSTLNGHPIFADTLVTTEAVIRAAPHLVRATAAAISAGWDAVAIDPERGIAATLFEQRDYSTNNADLQRAVQSNMLGLLRGRQGATLDRPPFGAQDSDWQPIIDAMKAAGIIKTEVNAGELFWR